MVARRPHLLTTLPGKQVGVGVSPSLDESELSQIRSRQSIFRPICPKTASVVASWERDLGLDGKNDYDGEL